MKEIVGRVMFYFLSFYVCHPCKYKSFYARVAAGRDVGEALHIYQSVHLASQHLAYSPPVQAKRTLSLQAKYESSLIGCNTAILAGIFDMLNEPASRCNNLQLLAVVLFYCSTSVQLQ
jgi:hypothetical protein